VARPSAISAASTGDGSRPVCASHAAGIASTMNSSARARFVTSRTAAVCRADRAGTAGLMANCGMAGGWLAVARGTNPIRGGTVPEQLPAEFTDLLERPLFAHLATVRPDGSPTTQVMWYAWDGERIRMTHTKTRQKYRNLEADPRVALSIADPDNQYRFIEIRGVVEKIEDDDAEAGFYKGLQQRYGMDYPIPDAAVRVILTIRPDSFVGKA
jgi:PPOX class probable F420-dependent enzyme